MSLRGGSFLGGNLWSDILWTCYRVNPPTPDECRDLTTVRLVLVNDPDIVTIPDLEAFWTDLRR